LEFGEDRGADTELDVPYEALSKQASHELDWNDTTVPQSLACKAMNEQVACALRSCS